MARTRVLPEEKAADSTRVKRARSRTRRSRLVIDREICVACAACPSVCHSLALSMKALRLELDEGLCDNCGSCVRACPVAALTLEDRKVSP